MLIVLLDLIIFSGNLLAVASSMRRWLHLQYFNNIPSQRLRRYKLHNLASKEMHMYLPLEARMGVGFCLAEMFGKPP